MNSPNDTTTTPNPNPNLREQLERIGLTAVAKQLDDILAHASKQRWSPRQLLEQLAQIEVAERAHRKEAAKRPRDAPGWFVDAESPVSGAERDAM
jgi:hypothetical protein